MFQVHGLAGFGVVQRNIPGFTPIKKINSIAHIAANAVKIPGEDIAVVPTVNEAEELLERFTV
jgi:hypothetical protein